MTKSVGSLKDSSGLMYERQESRKIKCHLSCWSQSRT